MKHVSDIAEKYLITGETQDTALMFVPSESVYAEIHDGFDDVIQKAYRARVVLVSPSLLMLAIQGISRSSKTRGCATPPTRSAPRCSTSATIWGGCATACSSCRSILPMRTRTSARS